MADLGLAALFAVFIWWFSTGLILLLDGLPRGTFRWSLVVSSLLAVAALLAMAHTASRADTASTYCAFTCALLVWGWHELSFLTGWITGPRRVAQSPGVRGLRRLWQALQAILWHELGIVAVGVAVVALAWNAPNPVGAWTFVVLWAMRTSAKINLFLGVRNLSEEFLPPHIAYLQSYFRRRAVNLFFPLAVSAATAALSWMVTQAPEPGVAPERALALTLAGTMLALGILEHWLLVLPIPAAALWGWAMRQRRRAGLPDGAALAPVPIERRRAEDAHVAPAR
jgi:putative photosynthetic complex assembly protein 2